MNRLLLQVGGPQGPAWPAPDFAVREGTPGTEDTPAGGRVWQAKPRVPGLPSLSPCPRALYTLTGTAGVTRRL